MERGTNVPVTAGGILGKLYMHSPHQRIDAMHAAQTSPCLNLLEYKKCMNVAAALFGLGLISMNSCWGFLNWVGLPHLLCVLYPYFNYILHTTFYSPLFFFLPTVIPTAGFSK